MRIIYLTLAAFILMGVAATCRTPPLKPGDCPPGDHGTVSCAGQGATGGE